MPVEIRELIIRAKIVSDSSLNSKPDQDEAEDYSDLIADCVDQVLKILERRQER